MKQALLVAMLLFPATAFASTADDLVECMVGKAAVVLHSQQNKDTAEALEIAYGGCGLEEADDAQQKAYEGVADYVNLMVERMAAE